MAFLSSLQFQNIFTKVCQLLESHPELVDHREIESFFNFTQATKQFCLKVNNENDDLLLGDHDIIPNQYEGGFKVWEGLLDLIKYLHRNSSSSVELSDSWGNALTICDLGCGSGLLSFYLASMIRKIRPKTTLQIFLQDFNETVIKYFTVPNIIINESLDQKIDSSTLQSIYKFVYGDWSLVKQSLVEKNIQFDLMVTSETIYNEENYEKLIDIFENCLKKPNGRVLVAGKSHYFGCGGGTLSFLDFLQEREKKNNSNQPYLQGEVVDEVQTTLLRQIIQIKWTCSGLI